MGYIGHRVSYPTDSPALGAFIEIGNGSNDLAIGTGEPDTIAAGLGSDTIEAGWGSTIYVPLEGYSTDTIDVLYAPYYGSGPFPHNTLVLPEGVTPSDLTYRLFTGAMGGVDTSQFVGAPETLELTYGDSTVRLVFDTGAPSWYLSGATSNDTDGINYVQFSDGTVLTRTQLLAMAGAAINPDIYNPVVTQTTFSPESGIPTPVSDFFTTSDASGAAPTEYEIQNPQGAQAGYFTLNETTYGSRANFYVAANQLSQLQYLAGEGNVFFWFPHSTE